MEDGAEIRGTGLEGKWVEINVFVDVFAND